MSVRARGDIACPAGTESLGAPIGKDGEVEAEFTSVATEPPWSPAAEEVAATVPRAEVVMDRSHVRQLTLGAFVILAALNVADVITTRMLLGHQGASEANPLAGVLLGNGTIMWVKLFCVLALALSTLKRSRPRVGVLLGAWTAVGIYAAAVLSNVLILRLLSGS